MGDNQSWLREKNDIGQNVAHHLLTLRASRCDSVRGALRNDDKFYKDSIAILGLTLKSMRAAALKDLDGAKSTALHVATFYGDLEATQMILAVLGSSSTLHCKMHGILSSDEHDRSALHWTIQQFFQGQRGVEESAFADCVESVVRHSCKLLPKKKFDDETFPADASSGNTPLHVLFSVSVKESASQKRILKILLDSCDDSAIFMVNKNQATAHDNMIMKGVGKTAPECSRLLQERYQRHNLTPL